MPYSLLLIFLFFLFLPAKESLAEQESEIEFIMEYFFEPEEKLSLEEIKSKPFKTIETKVVNFGLESGNAWFRFKIKGDYKDEDLFLSIDNNRLDIIEYFGTGNKSESIKTGDNLTFSSRGIEANAFIFPIEKVIPTDSSYHYFRINTFFSAYNFFPQIETKRQYQTRLENTELKDAFLLGILLTMLGFNFILFLTVRENFLLYYCLYAFSFIGFLAIYKGYSFMYLWPENPGYNVHAFRFFAIQLSVWALVFSMDFLDIKALSKKLYNFYILQISYYLLILASHFLFESHPFFRNLLSINMTLLVGTIIGSALFAIRKKRVFAIYFLFAWLTLLIGSTSVVLSTAGIFGNYVHATTIFEIGFTLEFLLITLGMIKKIKKKTENKLKDSESLGLVKQHFFSSGELSAGVAHEINQPLLAIIHLSEIAATDNIKHLKTMLTFKKINQSALAISKLIENFNLFTREPDNQSSKVYLSDIFEELRIFFYGICKMQKIELKLEMPSYDPNISIRKSQVQQILMNLCINAIEAITLNKTEKRLVIIKAEKIKHGKREFLRIFICDSGPEISEEIANEMLSPFFTTKEKENALGMGLTLAKQFASEIQSDIEYVRNPKAFVLNLKLASK